jgi:hypothetical protein
MKNVTIFFDNLSDMAYFIIECGIPEFTPDWISAALTARLKIGDINTAFADYNAHVIERDTAITK